MASTQCEPVVRVGAWWPVANPW